MALSAWRIGCLLFFVGVVYVVKSQGSEPSCSLNKEVVVPDANVRFAFMMSLRKTDVNSNPSPTSHICNLVSREPLQNYLAAEWVVDRLNRANNGTGYIPGIKFGFYGLDDCRSPVIASKNALSFLDYWVPSELKSCTGTATGALNIGIVGPSRSSTATRVASLVRDIDLPLISMASTSAELSNKADYPTFFRTVPSDTHQMKMIIDILSQLSWTYVAVVYINDDYGTSAIRILSEIAEERKICIHKTYPLSTSNTTFSYELLALLESAKDNSIAVVFIGSRDNAEQFLWTINKLPKKDGKEIRYGFHLILSDATNTDVMIYNNKEVGVGTMTVATSGDFLDDLHADLVAKVNRIKNGQEQHNLTKEYFQDFPNDELITPGSLNTFVPLTVHAVFALAEALRLQHLEACGGMPGLCQQLRTSVQDGGMVKKVKEVLVDYGSMEEGLPPDKFRENNYTLSFDKNGDIKQVNRVPAYTIHQYRGNRRYEQIGAYIAAQTELDMDKVKLLTPAGLPSTTIPSSVCATNCVACLNKNMIPIAFMEGDAYILGVFSLHDSDSEDPFKCGNFRSVANDAVVAEGFLYAIRDLRTITGINFGAIGIDDCYSALRSTSVMSDYFSGLVQSDINIFSHHIPKDKLVGVVACRSSGCTIPTASFFMPLNVPVISYAASSPDLDDRIDFPHFLRTVPSDVMQARVMLKIVQAMKWEYVGLLYVKNNYGAKAMRAFKSLAMDENSGVCVAEEVGLNEKSSELDDRDFFNAWSMLIRQDVKVVVFFGIDSRYRSFLSYMEKEERHGKFIFIGSEDWGNNADILKLAPKSARGSFTLKVEQIQLESDVPFKQHLAAKSPTANDSNIWFLEFWQNVFQCNFKGGFINTFNRNCDPAWKLSQDELNRRVEEQRVMQVMNAVYAMGRGLKEAKDELCEDGFPCNYLRQLILTVVNKIKSQTRKQGNFQYNVFNEDGNGAIGYDIFNIQQINGNQYDYVKIGTFNSKDEVFKAQDLKFYSETGYVIKEIESKCSEFLCAHCPKPSKPDGQQDKGDTSTMSEYRDSDILVISLIAVLILAVLVAVAVMVLCCVQKYRVLKAKLEGREDQIYAEPDRRVYQEYIDTHGIRFANASLNPYPQMTEGGGISNGDSSGTGVNNPAFVNDNIDSVSQVVAARNQSQQRLSQPDLRSRVRSSPQSLSTPLTSHYSSRPLPVSPIGSDNMNSYMHDNMAYQESSSDTNNVSNYPSRSTANISSNNLYNESIASDASTGGKTDRSTLKRTPDTQSVASGQPYIIIPTSGMTDATGVKFPEGVVYYMQGPNGQLTAQQLTMSTADGPTGVQPHTLQHQLSTSSGSTAINPNYGPYSSFAAQQQLQQRQQQQQQQQLPQQQQQHLQQQQQQMMSMNQAQNIPSPQYQNSPMVGSPTSGDIELQDMNSHNLQYAPNNSTSGHPQTMVNVAMSSPSQILTNRSISGPDVEYSPIHYASPSHGSQSSGPQGMSPTHYQTPPSRLDQQQVAQRGPPTGSTTPQLTHSPPDHQRPGEQEVLPHHYYQDSSPSEQDQSIMTHSIPDVIGHSAPAPTNQKPADIFDSVDLSSSKESLDNLDAEIQNPGDNNRVRLSALSALDGHVSRV